MIIAYLLIHILYQQKCNTNSTELMHKKCHFTEVPARLSFGIENSVNSFLQKRIEFSADIKGNTKE